jgi:hypothetical protein
MQHPKCLSSLRTQEWSLHHDKETCVVRNTIGACGYAGLVRNRNSRQFGKCLLQLLLLPK